MGENIALFNQSNKNELPMEAIVQSNCAAEQKTPREEIVDGDQDENLDFDVIIVGAGISGIGFAYRLQERLGRDLKYCILEGRHEIGGTWSLFKYPGIRSDSDLHSFGFPWRPWTRKEVIAHGSLISQYLKDCAAHENIDAKIRYHHRVEQISWSSASKTWSVDVDVKGTQSHSSKKVFRSRFLLLGTGYYNYEEPMKAEIPGIQNFQGPTIHPQFWPADLDYRHKNVAIIGSGATAITMLPAMAEDAAHVTMVQRSPSYIVSLKNGASSFDNLMRRLWPARLAARLIRLKWILMSFLMVNYCQWFPQAAKKAIDKQTRKQLPAGTALDPDFTPAYLPWQQRMCLCPNGDFYRSLRSGKASVKTGHIDRVTQTSIVLKSGEEIRPDIIVTATGLQVRLAGGMDILVDGKPYDISQHFMWKGAMVENLPNVVFALGYVDASWTLGADATAQLACRLLKRMQRDDVSMIVPRLSQDGREKLDEVPFMRLSSTYIQRGKTVFPRVVGGRSQWQRRSYYWKDLFMAKWGDIRSGLEWTK